MNGDETDGAGSTDVDGETRNTLCQHVECPNRIILHATTSGHSGCPLNLGRVCHFHITYEVNQTCFFAFCHISHSLAVRSSLYHISINVTKSGTEVRDDKWIHSFIPQSVSRQVHSLFQSEFSTQCDLVFPPSDYRILAFTLAAYVFFLVFPSLLSFSLSFLR